MSSTPAVSVILPVYNGEPHVREAIDSIRRQSFTDWELVAVDDGSKDGSPDVLRESAKADPRIRPILRSQNLGITATLNECCRAAVADLIAVTNHDDINLPDRLARQVKFLGDHKEVGAVGSQAWIVDDRSPQRRLKSVPTDPSLVSWSLAFFNPMIHPSVMMRTSAYRAVGGYPTGYPGGSEDYAFFVRLAECSQLANLDRPLLEYRLWSGNVTANRWQEQEAQADRIVVERARLLGLEITPAEANVLRGLSTGRYPTSTESVGRTAEIVESLLKATARRTPAPLSAAVNADAAVRLWLLAAIAARLAGVGLSMRLAAKATRIEALSGARFIAKAAARILAKNS